MFSTSMFSGSRTPAKQQVLLREAVTAVKKGDRAVARTLLREILHEDPRNSHAWLWLAGVADSVAEVTHCLEKVLEVDPTNQMATERLSMLRLLRYTSIDGTASDVGSGRPSIPPAPDPQALAVRGPAGEVVAMKHRPPAAAAPTLPPKPKPRNSVLTVCPLCQSDIDLRKQQCTRCGIITSMRSLQEVFANRGTDAKLIRAGIERWKPEHEKKPTPESAMALTLGSLNLHEFQAALGYLRTAQQLSPERKDLYEALDKLDRCPVVMVVDDSATIRHLVAHTLHGAGYLVRMAEDGVRALAMMQDNVPDLVFMDINMPRMDGYQVCKVVKNDPNSRRVPVIMLSGKDGFFDKIKGRLAGSSEYITKPFEADALVRCVEKHIAAHQRGGVDRSLAAAAK